MTEGYYDRGPREKQFIEEEKKAREIYNLFCDSYEKVNIDKYFWFVLLQNSTRSIRVSELDPVDDTWCAEFWEGDFKTDEPLYEKNLPYIDLPKEIRSWLDNAPTKEQLAQEILTEGPRKPKGAISNLIREADFITFEIPPIGIRGGGLMLMKLFMFFSFFFVFMLVAYTFGPQEEPRDYSALPMAVFFILIIAFFIRLDINFKQRNYIVTLTKDSLNILYPGIFTKVSKTFPISDLATIEAGHLLDSAEEDDKRELHITNRHQQCYKLMARYDDTELIWIAGVLQARLNQVRNN